MHGPREARAELAAPVPPAKAGAPRRSAQPREGRPAVARAAARAAASTSSGDACAVPTLPTTTPAAQLARTAASARLAPAARARAMVAITRVARARHVEHLARRGRARAAGGRPLSKRLMPCSPRVTSTARQPRSERIAPPGGAARSPGPRSRRPVACSASSWFGVTTVDARGTGGSGAPSGRRARARRRRRARGRTRFSSERGHDALLVVGDHEGAAARRAPARTASTSAASAPRRHVGRVLAVGPHHLLAVGDDARLHRGGPSGPSSTRRGLDARRGEGLAHALAGRVLARRPRRGRRRPPSERTFAATLPAPPRWKLWPVTCDDRHRRLRRDPRHAGPTRTRRASRRRARARGARASSGGARRRAGGEEGHEASGRGRALAARARTAPR